jgi:AraC-like DNA-binding protein
VFEKLVELGPGLSVAPGCSMHSNTHQIDVGALDSRSFLRVESANLGKVQICHVNSSGHRVELTETKNLTYLIPKVGGLEVATGQDEFVARAGKETMLFSPNTRRTDAYPADRNDHFRALALLFEASTIDHLSSVQKPVYRDAGFDRSLSASRRLASERSLIDYVSYIERELGKSESPLKDARVRQSAGALALDLFSSLICDVSRHSPIANGGHDVTSKYVKKAEDILLERFREPLSMVDVANEIGVSLRTLQLSFRKFRDLTPREFLARTRMEAVRTRLSTPTDNATITSIVFDCGFSHVGRFAKAYAATYGETPSATRHRCGD